MRGFMRSVWLLNPTTPSAGAGAAAQVPTQCLSLGKATLHSSALVSNPAATVASTAMDSCGIVKVSGSSNRQTTQAELSVAARRLVGRHSVAIAPQQFFHCPDAAWVTAGLAIDLRVLAPDIPAARRFALAAGMAQPERDELRAARLGIGTQGVLRPALRKRGACGGRQRKGDDSENRRPQGGGHAPAL